MSAMDVWMLLPFQIGDMVGLHGLKASSMNGRIGEIEGFNSERNRFIVRFDVSGERKLIRSQNLEEKYCLLYDDSNPEQVRLGESVRRSRMQMERNAHENLATFARNLPQFIENAKMLKKLPQNHTNKKWEFQYLMFLVRFLAKHERYRAESDQLLELVVSDPAISYHPRTLLETKLHAASCRKNGHKQTIKELKPHLRKHYGMVAQIACFLEQSYSETHQFREAQQVWDYANEEIQNGRCPQFGGFTNQLIANHALQLTTWYFHHNNQESGGTDRISRQILHKIKVAVRLANQWNKENNPMDNTSPGYCITLLATAQMLFIECKYKAALNTIHKLHMLVDRFEGRGSDLLKFIYPMKLSLYTELGDKKKANKMILQLKRLGNWSKELEEDVQEMEARIKKIKKNLDSGVSASSQTLKRCSNLECDRVETRPQEFQTCSLCKIAKYCSRECQKKDWKKCHKKLCKRNAK